MEWTAPNGIVSAKLVVLIRNQQRGPPMGKISMIGLDLAKNVFQIHGIDAEGKVVLQRQLRRGQMEKFFAKLPPTVVGMEACSGAHHWARLFQKLGHEVRIMPPAYVKPYATAILAAVGDARTFKTARDFAAWLGLMPRQFSTGGKQRSGHISKQGDRTLRSLLTIGATSHLHHQRARRQ